MVLKVSEDKTNDEKPIEYRNEILFLYDVTNANPNGDPYNNKPRIDQWSERNLVSDTRLKRTVRDYLLARGEGVFVKIEYNADGSRKTREDLSAEVWETVKGDRSNAIKEFNKAYIDFRLFGATVAAGKKVKKSKKSDQPSEQSGKSGDPDSSGETESNVQPVNWTGPVQFKIGQSLHSVEISNLKGTTVLPSKAENTAGTFTDFWYVPYSLIAFYGIVNEEQAKNTGLKEGDIDKLLDALWNGTKGLISRSKFGQMPRLLLQVSYVPHFHVGNLDNRVSLQDRSGNSVDTLETKGKNIRSIEELRIDISKLVNDLKSNSKNIKKIRIRTDESTHYAIGNLVVMDLIETLSKMDEFKGKVERIEDKDWAAK